MCSNKIKSQSSGNSIFPPLTWSLRVRLSQEIVQGEEKLTDVGSLLAGLAV